jgi:hypothetical protein
MQYVTAICSHWETDEERFFKIGKAALIFGVLLMMATFYELGYLPILSDAPGAARYVRVIAGTSTRALADEWLVNRALDLLTCAIPIVFLAAIRKRRIQELGWVILGLATILLPARRANVLSVMLLVIMIRLLLGAKVLRYVPFVILALALLFASQQLFVNSHGLLSTNEVIGSVLPELRDFAWTMSLMGNRSLDGMTFLQAVLPIPSFLSDYYQRYSLREITNTLTGLKEGERSGGLRITLAGESYLNFGYFGPVLAGFLFGVLCAYLDVALRIFRARRSLSGLYLVSMCVVWSCFWLYLAGTQASATIRIGLIVVVFVLYFAKTKTQRARQYSTNRESRVVLAQN